ncbi:MAG: 5-formyltetrahydrofolate cyclo-ligase [Akkermansiaceae bacterium]
MWTDARDNKAIIRRMIRYRLQSLSSSEKKTASEDICSQILSLQPKVCAIFANTANEPSLLPLLDSLSSTIWLLPKVTGKGTMEFFRVSSPNELTLGTFDIMEPLAGLPITPPEIDTIICPGLAFTKKGDRLGQGGGFYDRFLKRCPQAIVYGACFEIQVLPRLPRESHDHQVSKVIHA